MSNIKEIQQFELVMKKTNKIDDGNWTATTAKRQTVIIPKGVKVWDTDLKKMYIGDGSTMGGVTDSNRNGIRKIQVAAAASGTLSADATTDKITWPEGGAYIRTGDAITIAAGTGTVPSGTSATTYYILKTDDGGDIAGNTGTSFKLATTRANALAGTTVDILGSGAPGWTAVIADVVAQYGDEIVHIDPLGANIDFVLPDADAAATEGFKCFVKKDTGAFTVTVKELDASGNVSGGIDNIDNLSGPITMYANYGDKIQFYCANDEWFTTMKYVSGAWA